jgi:hypothetical protein
MGKSRSDVLGFHPKAEAVAEKSKIKWIVGLMSTWLSLACGFVLQNTTTQKPDDPVTTTFNGSISTR